MGAVPLCTLKTKSSVESEEWRDWAWIENTGSNDGRLSETLINSPFWSESARDAVMELKDLNDSRVKPEKREEIDWQDRLSQI
jgi:hypothetical protein